MRVLVCVCVHVCARVRVPCVCGGVCMRPRAQTPIKTIKQAVSQPSGRSASLTTEHLVVMAVMVVVIMTDATLLYYLQEWGTRASSEPRHCRW